MRITNLVIIFCLAFAVGSAWAEKFEGPGPDPACGGTLLTIEKKEGKVAGITYAIIGSVSTIVEEFKPRSKGGWDVTVSVYATAKEDGTPIKERLVAKHKFVNTEAGALKEELAKIGLAETKWAKEPARLVKYLEKNPKEFDRS